MLGRPNCQCILCRSVAAYKAMPFLVGNLALLGIAGGAFGILFSVFPIGEVFDENGRPISYWEFWSSGRVFMVLLFVLPIFLFGIGAFRRWNWVRVIWPVFTLVSVISCWFAPEANLAQSIPITVIFVLISAYFWRSKKVRTYFEASLLGDEEVTRYRA